MNRFPFDLAIAVLACFSGAAATAQVTPAGIQVVDSTGKLVGRTVGVEKDRVTVALQVEGHLLVIRVFQDHFTFEGPGNLFFESKDCSGPPFIAVDLQNADGEVSVLPLIAIPPPGTTVYAPVQGEPPRTIAAQSELGTFQSTPCFAVLGLIQGALPATPLLDLNSQFTPPFRAVPSSSVPSGDCNGDGTVDSGDISCVISRIFGGSAQSSAR